MRWRGSARAAGRPEPRGCGASSGPEPCEPRTWELLEAFRKHRPTVSGIDLYRTLAYEAWRRWLGHPAPPAGAPLELDPGALVELKGITADLLAFHALAAVEGGALGGPSAELAAWALERVGVAPTDLYSREPARRDALNARLDQVADDLWRHRCERCEADRDASRAP